LTTKAKKPSKASPAKQALEDEVAELRAQLAEAEVLFEYREFRSQALSKMLNLGIWEWDEKADKPLSYSDELADVFGVNAAGLKKLFQNRDNFERIVHPDDLELFRSHLDSKSILKPGKCAFTSLPSRCPRTGKQKKNSERVGLMPTLTI